MTPADIADLRAVARRRLPRALFDWVDGGAFLERTARANVDDFARLKFRQRAFVDTSGRSAATTLLGQAARLPFAISPTGMSGVLWPGGGEVVAARAARAENIPYTLAMLSICSIEEVVAAAGPVWFQVAMMRRRELTRDLIERAAALECPVLVVTATMPVPSRLNRSVRNRLYAVPPHLDLRNLLDYGTHPGWVLRMLAGRRIGLGNFAGIFPKGQELTGVIGQFDDTADWTDLEWIRSLWSGKLLVKGIVDAKDAHRAIACGADGVSVSNHGGIQLDDAPSTITTLRKVVEAVDGRAEVMLDGGVRSGQDVLKAMALGARGCLLGRAHLWGMAADGEAGVRQAIGMIAQEIDITLALTGTVRLADIGDAIIASPAWPDF